MANATVTSLGRVQPLYKGTYVHGTEYNQLDNVLYSGNTYVSLVNGNINHYPTDSRYWQVIAQKGDRGVQGYTGSFGTTDGTVTMHSSDDPTATVVVTNDGPDTAKNFHFAFNLPEGPVGYDDVAANATSLGAGTSPTAEAELITIGLFSSAINYSKGSCVIYNNKIYQFITDHTAGAWNLAEVKEISNVDNEAIEAVILNFDFGIPAAEGTGAQYVDGIGADASYNVNLSAVRYVSQSLSSVQKAIARTNIEALAEPDAKNYGQFLRYAGNVSDPSWVAEDISQVPLGGTTGYVLRKQVNGYGWTPVYEMPNGGNAGAILFKNSNSDYDFGWMTTISDEEIDSIINE